MSGIGLATAKQLAQQPIQLVIVGRNAEKSRQAVAEIQKASGNANVTYLTADLAKLSEVQALAQAYQSQFSRLDVLINNAGALFSEDKRTPENFEMNLMVNYLSPAALCLALQPVLETTASQYGEARILNVASDSYKSGVDWADLNFEKRKYSLFAAYGQSKAMIMMFSFELARRLEKSGVTVNTLHPGAVRTDIAQKSGSRLFVLLLKVIGPFIFITPEQAGTNIVHVTTSPDLKAVTGQYFDGRKRATPEKFALNQADWAKLWQLTQTWLSEGKP